MSQRQRVRCSSFAGAGLCIFVSACSVDQRTVGVAPSMAVEEANPSSVGMSPMNVGTTPDGAASNSGGEGTGGALPIAPATPPAATPPAATTPPAAPLILPDRDITLRVSGTGRVTSSPPGIDCPGVCSARFTGGSSVTLTAEGAPESDSYFEGWSGDCSGFDTCPLVVDQEHSVAGSFGAANIVFVTSTIVDPGRLGGLAAGDQICQTQAAVAGLPGTYVAWLSNSSVNAIDRIAGARGWVRPDGLAVADEGRALFSGQMFHPIRVNEAGVDIGWALVVTGTNSAGLWDDSSCGDWNTAQGLATYGTTDALSANFTDAASNSCDRSVTGPLYCFGIDRSVRVEPLRSTGRLAFVSGAPMVSGGGIAAADALCQSEARAAGHTGTFLAELAAVGVPPEARFNLNGAPWVRPDGVLLADTAAGYFLDQLTSSAPNLNLNGQYRTGDRNWYGQRLGQPITSDSTCADWTSATGSTGVISSTTSTYRLFATAIGIDCSDAYRVICLEN